MEAEQDKIVWALKVAIQMEVDGEDFYLKASQKVVMSWGRSYWSP